MLDFTKPLLDFTRREEKQWREPLRRCGPGREKPRRGERSWEKKEAAARGEKPQREKPRRGERSREREAAARQEKPGERSRCGAAREAAGPGERSRGAGREAAEREAANM